MMNSVQIKAGFKKEWLQFSRTFRFGGVILAILSFAIADPAMYKLLAIMMASMPDLTAGIVGFVSQASELDAAFEQMTALYSDAGIMYGAVLTELSTSSVLITMLILMSPCGGEQKKRATIIPSACGMEFGSYLLPKFLLYPLTVLAVTFGSSLIAGFMCNAMFELNRIDTGLLVLGALLCAVYSAFIIVIYMCMGLCTSRPGIATISVYFGSALIKVILDSLELTKFHPFTLSSLIAGEMFMADFDLADNAASIAVGVVLSVVIAVVLFFLTLTVLKANKINNQENKPEF